MRSGQGVFPGLTAELLECAGVSAGNGGVAATALEPRAEALRKHAAALAGRLCRWSHNHFSSSYLICQTKENWHQ